jgi:hypothetical protein
MHESADRRRLGLSTRFVFLCLGFAAFGASIGLFATGSWVWALVFLFVAGIVLAALAETTRRTGGSWVEHSSRLAADGRAHAATTAEVWRTRFDASLSRRRTRSRLDSIASERRPALQALGEAVWSGDETAERDARQRLVELEEEAKRVEDALAERLAGADERIRKARLPVQDTLMVTTDAPRTTDEAPPPTPASEPGQTESE